VPTKRLFVGNLPFSANEADLMEAFEQFGASSARIIEGRGFGFVDVPEENMASAIENMNGADFGGRRLTVNEARPREDRPRG